MAAKICCDPFPKCGVQKHAFGVSGSAFEQAEDLTADHGLRDWRTLSEMGDPNRPFAKGNPQFKAISPANSQIATSILQGESSHNGAGSLRRDVQLAGPCCGDGIAGKLQDLPACCPDYIGNRVKDVADDPAQIFGPAFP